MKEKCLNDLKSREEKSLTVNRTQVVHELTAAQNQIKKLKFELKSLEEQLKSESEVLKNERIELKNAENREEKCLNDLKSREKILTQLTSDRTQVVHEFNAAREKYLVINLYCLDIRSAGNPGNNLLVLHNDQEIGTLAEGFEDFYRCFIKNDEPNVANDIFEIRHNGGDDGASIHVSIVDEGTRTDLLFGPNADLDSITMDSSSVWSAVAHIPGRDGNYCLKESEAASSIKFQNGVIIESECVEAS